MSSHLFIYQQQCFFRLCSVSSPTFFFSRLSVVNSNFNPKESLQTLVITFTVRWWTPRSSSQHHTENMSSKFGPKKQFLNTRTGSFTPSLGPNFLPLFFSSFPSLLFSPPHSCIVCLHQAAPQNPSLTLRGMEFGLIYQHLSLFVWMSYGPSLLVCSVVVITKAVQ